MTVHKYILTDLE